MQTVIPQNRETLVSQNVPHSKFLRSLVTAKISDFKVVLLYFPDILNRSVDVRSLIAPIKGKYSKQFGLEGGGGGGHVFGVQIIFVGWFDRAIFFYSSSTPRVRRIIFKYNSYSDTSSGFPSFVDFHWSSVKMDPAAIIACTNYDRFYLNRFTVRWQWTCLKQLNHSGFILFLWNFCKITALFILEIDDPSGCLQKSKLSIRLAICSVDLDRRTISLLRRRANARNVC